MTPRLIRRHAYWLLPLIAGTVVALVGARLITLSVRERSQQTRLTAQTAAIRHAQLINAQLLALVTRAHREAERVQSGAGPGSGSFLMKSDAAVVTAGTGDATLARAVASERGSGAAAQTYASLFGPVRYGSQWIVAARVPVQPEPPGADFSSPLWSISYDSLDALLARAGFGTLVSEGYDFQLSQSDPLTGRSRTFISSQPTELSEPAVSTIVQPAASPGAAASAFLTLAIRPRAGWYPAHELAAEIGLLALLTWGLAFGAYDLTHSLRRTQSALADARRRLHEVNVRLVGEIEQRQTLQKSFEHARYHDAFTGLPNRRYFMDQVDRALRQIRTRRRQRIAIALVDIERLRLISDTLGHTAGDELLLQAAQRCAQSLGDVEHVLARWGGSQLAVLVYELASSAAAQSVADKLLRSCQQPFELRQHRLSVTARVGYTCIDTGVQRADDVLRDADLALTVANEQHSERAVPYAQGMAGAAVSLVSLEADLHVALDRHEFQLLFQPIIDLRGQRAVGAEALLRWRHPVEGLLTPDRFLAIAEEAGMIVPITRWIIQRVCRLAAEWRQRLSGSEDFYISVNLSAAVLRSPGLRDHVAHALEETQLPSAHLKFELSEAGLISNVAAARAVLDAFHDMGIELMLDDFGSGFSSLSYLQLFPFDYVKIDRPFVSRTGSERANNAITAAILQMASNLGLRAVAEVVETKAAAQTLVDMGCEFAQGYFFCPPVGAEEVFRQLRSGGVSGRLEAEDEPEETGAPLQRVARDDSPTLILPAGLILESRITDEADTDTSNE